MKLPFVSRELYERVLQENTFLRSACERLEIKRDELMADLLTAQEMSRTAPEEDKGTSSKPRRLHGPELRQMASDAARKQFESTQKGKPN